MMTMNRDTGMYSDNEIRNLLLKVERKAHKNKAKITWWEGNFIDGLCRRNRDATMTVFQKRAALEIVDKYS